MGFFGQARGAALGIARPRILQTAKKGEVVTITDVTGSVIEIRDPNTTTQKLAVDANGKIGVSSLPNVTIGTMAALVTGSAAIGKLAANTGVDIGDVDVTSLPALAAGTNIIGAVKRDIVSYTKVCKYVALSGTSETTVWDPTGGTKFVITDIFVSATAAGTCTIRDGTAGTIFLIASLAANGGFVTNLQTPIQSATADNNLTAQASAATQYVTVCGYEV